MRVVRLRIRYDKGLYSMKMTPNVGTWPNHVRNGRVCVHWVFMISFVTLEVSSAAANCVLVQAVFSNFARFLLWRINIPISVDRHY